MHSYIFQISLSPIAEDLYPDSDIIVGGDMVTVDYATPLYDEQRKEAIRKLADSLLPKGMFRVNPDGVSLTYKGGYTEWSKTYTAELHKMATKVKSWNVMDYIGPAYQLQKFIVNPLIFDDLFIVDFDTLAEKSRAMMGIVDKMGIGEKLYIGAVFDYHY